MDSIRTRVRLHRHRTFSADSVRADACYVAEVLVTRPGQSPVAVGEAHRFPLRHKFDPGADGGKGASVPRPLTLEEQAWLVESALREAEAREFRVPLMAKRSTRESA